LFEHQISPADSLKGKRLHSPGLQHPHPLPGIILKALPKETDPPSIPTVANKLLSKSLFRSSIMKVAVYSSKKVRIPNERKKKKKKRFPTAALHGIKFYRHSFLPESIPFHAVSVFNPFPAASFFIDKLVV
jgi:hypothetical protein